MIGAGKDENGNAYAEIDFPDLGYKLRITYIPGARSTQDLLRLQKWVDGRILRREDDPILDIPAVMVRNGPLLMALGSVVHNGSRLGEKYRKGMKERLSAELEPRGNITHLDELPNLDGMDEEVKTTP